MTPRDFEFISNLIRKRSGLVLSKDKMYLLESRLLPVSRQHGFGSLDDLITKVCNGGGEPLITDVVEAMTTNETFFFRDKIPFDQFRDHVLRSMLERRRNRRQARISCAACSTGQEPYSIAMLLKERGRELDGWRFEIVATDLSNEALGKAKVGLYSQFEVQRGLPVQLLVKYFKQVNETWQIDSAIRAMVSLRQLNLLDDFGALGHYDVVFCRNVLIYFDPQTKAEVLRRIRRGIENDGFLFLGGSETVLAVSEAFRPTPGYRGVYTPV